MTGTMLALAIVIAGCSDSTLTKNSAAPEAEISSHSDGQQVVAGEALSLFGRVWDDDDASSDLTAIWYLDGLEVCAGAADEDGVTTCEAAVPDELSELVVVLEVLDPADASGSDAVTLLVQDTEGPLVTILAPTKGGAYYADRQLTFEGVATDAEDAPDELTVTWSSDVDGTLDIAVTPSADGGFIAATNLTEGEHFITLTATDTDGKIGTDGVLIEVLPANAAPSAPTVSITPPDPFTNDDLLAVIDAPSSDDDGDPISYAYQWYLDGTLSEGRTASLVPADETAAGETWTVRVTPSDGEVDGDYGEASVTIGNTAPSAPAVAITPSDPVERVDELLCQVAGASTDADGDAVAYAVTWDVDGAAYSGATTTAESGDTVLASATSAGEVWTCTVTPDDGLDAGPAGADAVTIGASNGRPGAPVVAISPDPADTGDDLSVSLTTPSSDPEGDTISYAYAWFRDGAATGYTDESVPSSATASGETWRVEVTPSDAGGDGTAGADEVTIDNTAPTAPGVTIDPSEPLEGADDLICQITSASTDTDGDTVSYTFSWDVDGAAYGGALSTYESGDTVDGAVTVAGETWTCTVTPGDGADDGASGADAVVIVEEDDAVSDDLRVFVTSTVYDGDLGGLSGADEACQDRADDAGLGGDWKAWLSDSTTDAADRLVHTTGQIVRVDGGVVADSWADLVASWPLVAPEIDEYGSRIPYEGSGSEGGCSWAADYFFFPWTATGNDGLLDGQTCDDWTDNTGSYTGRVGLGGYSLSQWTTWCDFSCNRTGPLYCFEQ